MSDQSKALDWNESGKLAKHLKIIREGKQTFIAVGNSLMAIRDERLYRESHKTFEAFCDDVLELSSRRVNQLIGASEVVAEMGTIVPKPKNEAQARELAKLPKEDRAEAMADAKQAAGDKPVTAKHVKAAVEKRKPAKAPAAEPEKDGTEPFHPPAPTAPDPDSLEAAQAGVADILRDLRQLQNTVKRVLAVDGQDITAPWMGRYSYLGAVESLREYARIIKAGEPVGGTAKKPISRDDQKTKDALAKKGDAE